MRAIRRTTLITVGAGIALAALVSGTAEAAGAGVTVSLTNSGPSPATVSVGLGGKVTWKSTLGSHTVTDSSPLKLFSGVTSFVFKNSGTYPYKVSGAAKGGSVGVPVTLTKGMVSGQVGYDVRWATVSTSCPLAASVQFKAPTGGWQSFVFSSCGTHDATFRPVDWGNKHGTYSFRARYEKGSAHTAWSPVASFKY